MPPKKSKTSDAKGPKTSSRKRKRENENDLQAKVEEKKSVESYSHWIMKSEPESRFENGVDLKFGIEDLKQCEKQTACWDGVRNYQARNFMRDQMKIGHKVFFYHSNCKEPGIAGICKIVKESYPDHTQFDSADPHYDRSAKKDAPKWFMVDVKFERMLKRFIPLSELKSLHLNHKADGGTLKNMALFTRARLSVQPVTTEEWDFIINLENEKT
ncbi:thymocyte nuclear protein 1-like [Mytilus californianus]|uniref:thymocyte nuclear protein 1-like n=1 Tax=Mytilus californianus TaxID=6549 RepID=UPI0022458D08|nr:thymocyte nuclear protein 1-like [Mytilus californianus]